MDKAHNRTLPTLPTVTVGISAFNEEKNIGHLLAAMTRQHSDNFKLREILVCCDGCTDRTVNIVRHSAENNKFVHIIEGKRRLGKAYRLNQLFRRSAGDILILLDADVIPANERVLSELVRRFDDETVGLVGGDITPLPSRTVMGNITVASRELWAETVRGIHGGATVHNHHGQVSAMRKDVYKHIRMPLINAEDDYRYCKTKQLGYSFRFAPRASVFYRTPETLRDFFMQSARFSHGRNLVTAHLGSWVAKEYAVPTRNKILATLTLLRRKPFTTVMTLAFHFILRIASRQFQGFGVKKGKWTIATSTKHILRDTHRLNPEYN